MSVIDTKTFTLAASASPVDSVYAGHVMVVAGEYRVIEEYGGATRRVTVRSAFVTAPTTTSTYNILSRSELVFGSTASWDHPTGTLSMSILGTTTLTAAVATTAASSISVVDASLAAIGTGVAICVGEESMLVTSVSSNTLTVVRGHAGTPASTHTSGATVGTCTAPGYLYVFSVSVGNPALGQASPRVYISSSSPVQSIVLESAGVGYIVGEVDVYGGEGGSGAYVTFTVSSAGAVQVSF